jgi:AraC-like DNA-binding protein
MGRSANIPAWGFRHADALMPGVVASVVGYAADGIELSIHRGLPSPHLTVVITLDEPVITGWSIEEASGPQATCVDVVTAGLHTAPAYIRQPPAQSGIQLALYPSAARTILGLPAAELCQATYEGSDVVGPEISRLRDRLIETSDWTARFTVVQRFLQARTDRAEGRGSIRPEIVEAWTWLARHRGAGRISALAAHVLLSQRQLHSLFRAEFGLGPKGFNRLLRFQHAKQLITDDVGHQRKVDLAGIAARCGYADQAHLTRDFGSLVGTSPTRWLAEEFGTAAAGGYRQAEQIPPKSSIPAPQPGSRLGP